MPSDDVVATTESSPTPQDGPPVTAEMARQRQRPRVVMSFALASIWVLTGLLMMGFRCMDFAALAKELFVLLLVANVLYTAGAYLDGVLSRTKRSSQRVRSVLFGLGMTFAVLFTAAAGILLRPAIPEEWCEAAASDHASQP